MTPSACPSSAVPSPVQEEQASNDLLPKNQSKRNISPNHWINSFSLSLSAISLAKGEISYLDAEHGELTRNIRIYICICVCICSNGVRCRGACGARLTGERLCAGGTAGEAAALFLEFGEGDGREGGGGVVFGFVVVDFADGLDRVSRVG